MYIDYITTTHLHTVDQHTHTLLHTHMLLKMNASRCMCSCSHFFRTQQLAKPWSFL